MWILYLMSMFGPVQISFPMSVCYCLDRELSPEWLRTPQVLYFKVKPPCMFIQAYTFIQVCRIRKIPFHEFDFWSHTKFINQFWSKTKYKILKIFQIWKVAFLPTFECLINFGYKIKCNFYVTPKRSYVFSTVDVY